VPWKKGNRLRVVPEAAADEGTAAIFADLKQALGLAFLPLFYGALGAYPGFLQMHWKLLGPVARSRELRESADRLRADAYTRAHNYFRIPDLCASLPELKLSEGARQELTAVMEFFNSRDGMLLLLFSAQLQALEAPVGRADPPTAAGPPAAGDDPPVLVLEENAPAAVRRLYGEIRRELDLPYINSEYQALARWPDFLSVSWELLKSLRQSPLYGECEYRVRETGWSLARELPGPLELSLEQLTEAGMAQDDIASVGRILELFVKNLSGLVLDLAIDKIALEGGNQLKKPEKPSAGSPGRAA